MAGSNSISLCLAQDPEADQIISTSAFALLVGMVLDQQIPLEKAFCGPKILQERLGQPLTAEVVASTDLTRLKAVFSQQPAIHRFPSANAERVAKLAEIVLDEYDGDAASIWTNATSGEQLLEAINNLPGFGIRKSQIFVALLGKQLGFQPKGWQQACKPFGNKGTSMSIADITDEASLQRVRQWKKAQKAKAADHS